MIKRLPLALLAVLLLFSGSSAIPPAPTGGHVVPPSTPFFTLTVIKTGSGAGTVTAAGIDCGLTCDEDYPQNVIVFLFASPSPGSTFTGWSGACTGTGSCSVLMSAVKSVTATFTVPTVTFDLYATNNGLQSGNCSTTGTACDLVRVLQVVTCGQTIGLMDGVYAGSSSRNRVDMVASVPPSRTCSQGSPISLRAINEGAVTLDGGGTIGAWFWLVGLSYWNFSGFNVTNNDETASIGITAASAAQVNHNLQFQRMCFSNSAYPPLRGSMTTPYQDTGNDTNRHVVAVVSTQDSLFEDVCVFGTGRVGLNEREQSFGNVYRRLWVRWEGWYNAGGIGGLTDCGGPPIQAAYATPQNSTFENIITIWNPERVQAIGPSHPCYQLSNVIGNGGYLNRDTPPVGSPGYKWLGWVGYGYPNSYIVAPTIKWWATGGGDDLGNHAQLGTATDMFIDGREWPRTGETADPGSRNVVFFCQQPQGPVVPCPGYFVSRVTSIRSAGRPPYVSGDFNEGSWGLFANFNECVGTAGVVGPSLGGCPGFYTGDSPGTGARQCFEYLNGTLTTTPKWPWRMDDRIKAALTYERNAGRGGTALEGVAGSGGSSTWGANTVTSEIISRYGSIPSACVR